MWLWVGVITQRAGMMGRKGQSYREDHTELSPAGFPLLCLPPHTPTGKG